MVPASVISIILWLNIYFIRIAENTSTQLILCASFYILFVVLITRGYTDVLLHKNLLKFIDEPDFKRGIKRNRLAAPAYIVLQCALSYFLLFLQVLFHYQVYIDVLFFSWVTIELFRGFNARFQLQFIQKAINELIREKRHEERQSRI